MTVALGMLSIGGFILATDSQETAGPFKRDQRKIMSAEIRRGGKSGACAIAGAGHAGYIDNCTTRLLDLFRSNGTTIDNWQQRVEDELCAFYAKHVIPFGRSSEELDFSLIIAAQINGTSTMLTTNKTTAMCGPLFTAIGYGESTARALYDQVGRGMLLDGRSGALLAGYLVYRVKQVVDSCGHQTQVVVVQDNQAKEVSYDNTWQWEAVFRQYEAAAAHLLWSSLCSHIDCREPRTESDYGSEFAPILRPIDAAFREIASRTLANVEALGPVRVLTAAKSPARKRRGRRKRA